jgi:hypothetical protein
MTLLLLTLAYVAVLVLLLNLGFHSQWRWQVKLMAVLLSVIFYAGTWYGLKQLQGWAVIDQIPDKFRLVSEYIVQPDKQRGTEGAIYVWVIDLGEDAESEPRAYRLPYIEQLHEDIVTATADGRQKIGKRVEPVSKPGAASQNIGSMIEFYDEPRIRLPGKD